MNVRSPRRPTARSRARAAVAEAILDAAEAVAGEHGIAAASAAAIARRAGVAVGTLYNYFPDRDGIFAALFVARRTAIAPRLRDAAAATAHLPFAPRLREFVARLLGVFEDQRAFLRLAIAGDQDVARAKAHGPALVPLLEDVFDDIMAAGAAAGQFPAALAPAHARMVLGAVKALALWRIGTGQPMHADAALVCDAWLAGITR